MVLNILTVRGEVFIRVIYLIMCDLVAECDFCLWRDLCSTKNLFTVELNMKMLKCWRRVSRDFEGRHLYFNPSYDSEIPRFPLKWHTRSLSGSVYEFCVPHKEITVCNMTMMFSRKCCNLPPNLRTTKAQIGIGYLQISLVLTRWQKVRLLTQ